MSRNHKIMAFQAFAMYFLTGAACFVVGSSLPQLTEMYGMDLNKVVLLGSAFAFGRVSTVYLTGKMVEKFGPKVVLSIGVVLIGLFFVGVPLLPNFYAGMVFAFCGGAGMGAQDTVCPLFLSIVFTRTYSGSLSAGQALFGLGSFATPFLIGLMLANKYPFYLAYFILFIVVVVMLALMPFMKVERKVNESGNEDSVEPLYVKNKVLVYGAMFVVCAAYSAVVNSIGLYTSSIVEDMGIASSTAAFVLTVYNVGCFMGSTAFIYILQKVQSQTVLIVNNVIALIAIVIVIFSGKLNIYFVGLFVAGFVLGVLFSVIIDIATRIGHEHISIAGSLVATASGGSDCLTPIITGALVGIMGVRIAFCYTALMIALCLISAIIIKAGTTDKKIELN